MKILSGEEIQRLSRIRAMFPEDWCQAQLEDDQKDYDALKVIEESHRKLNGELREQMKSMDGLCEDCGHKNMVEITPEEADRIMLYISYACMGVLTEQEKSIVAKLKPISEKKK